MIERGFCSLAKLENVKRKDTKYLNFTGLISILIYCYCSLASVLSVSNVDHFYDNLSNVSWSLRL